MSDHPEEVPRFDRYEVQHLIARGGMAEVYLARLEGEAGFVRHVAIKRIRPHLLERPEFVTMFLDEARVAAAIRSPYVVQTLELGRDDAGAPFIVMEYVDGMSLRRLLSSFGGPPPLPIALAILIDAAKGLHAAHEATGPAGEHLHIVHRDVSPQNILVGLDGRARITDFGIARAINRATETETGQIKGKYRYLSPEQARARPVDFRADLFSLGVVAWETLAGRRLFSGNEPVEVLESVLLDPIPRLDELGAPGVDAELAAIVEKALSRDPDDRHPNARSLARELGAVAKGLAVCDEESLGSFVRDVQRGVLPATDGGVDDDASTVSMPSPPALALEATTTPNGPASWDTKVIGDPLGEPKWHGSSEQGPSGYGPSEHGLSEHGPPEPESGARPREDSGWARRFARWWSSLFGT